MHDLFRQAVLAAGIIACASGACAGEFSSSAIAPTEVPTSGLIAGNFPPVDTETSYYFAVQLKPGDLATQISFLGRPDRDKSLELDLKDAKGKLVSYYTIMSGLDANQEATRVFQVDASGRYQIVLKLKGPETTAFQVELGGSSFPNRQTSAAGTGAFSRSYLAPSPLPKDGVISGIFPGGDKRTTYYYFATELKAGDLLTQISYAGRRNAPKMLEFALLDSKGRAANSSYYIMGDLDANNERTRAYPVDSSGRHILRVGVSGVEGTQFKVELGGNAYQGN